MEPTKNANAAAQGNNQPSRVAGGRKRSRTSPLAAAEFFYLLVLYILKVEELQDLNSLARSLTDAPLDGRRFARLFTFISALTRLVDSLDIEVNVLKERMEAAGLVNPPPSPAGDSTLPVPDLNHDATPPTTNGGDGEDKADGDIA